MPFLKGLQGFLSLSLPSKGNLKTLMILIHLSHVLSLDLLFLFLIPFCLPV